MVDVPVVPLPIVVPRIQVLRYMGYPRAKTPSATVLRTIHAWWDRANELVAAQGAFVIVDRAVAGHAGMPAPTREVALAVCTIGRALEIEATEQSDGQDVLAALFLDAFGSAAAEEAAEALHRRICATLHVRQLKAGRRVSPGYGSWGVGRQADLLVHLPIARVGVALSPSFLMIPRKSVSFAARLVDPQQTASSKRCGACDLADCLYRQHDQVESSGSAKETKQG